MEGNGGDGMHGGAKGVGAPLGNKNALKHGLYTVESRAFTKHIRELIREGSDLVEKF